MSYILLNKFRGAFLGSLAHQNLKTLELDSQSSFYSHSLSEAIKPQWFLGLQQEIVSIMPRQENLVNAWFETVFELLLTKNLLKTANCSVFVLLSLPIIIYYCDYWLYLTEYIEQKGQKFAKSSEEITAILVWCYGVRLALRGELISSNLTHCFIQEAQVKQQKTTLWLEKLKISYFEGWSLSQLLTELSSPDNEQIPLSLSCFLNNAEDFELIIQQASFLEEDFTLVTALSGVLGGAYNGLTGIALNWRNSNQNQNYYQQLIIQIEEMTKEWLGIDGAANIDQASCIITAPQILQPRSSLKVISQEEYRSKFI